MFYISIDENGFQISASESPANGKYAVDSLSPSPFHKLKSDNIYKQFSGFEQWEIDQNKKIEFNKEEFNNNFFQTTIGYVRRKVTIKGTGETKDFLADCLPALCNAFSFGQNIQSIIYDMPDFTTNVEDWTQYQKTIDWTDKTIQQQFLADCLAQYQKDFFGG